MLPFSRSGSFGGVWKGYRSRADRRSRGLREGGGERACCGLFHAVLRRRIDGGEGVLRVRAAQRPRESTDSCPSPQRRGKVPLTRRGTERRQRAEREACCSPPSGRERVCSLSERQGRSLQGPPEGRKGGAGLSFMGGGPRPPQEVRQSFDAPVFTRRRESPGVAILTIFPESVRFLLCRRPGDGTPSCFCRTSRFPCLSQAAREFPPFPAGGLKARHAKSG